MKIGCKCWAIPEGYIPSYSKASGRELISHEAACLLNATEEDALVEIVIYFSDRDPIGPYKVTVPAKRTKHVRFNDLTDPAPIPLGTDYSSVITSNVDIVVQHTRLDSRQAEVSLMTTIAYGC